MYAYTYIYIYYSICRDVDMYIYVYVFYSAVPFANTDATRVADACAARLTCLAFTFSAILPSN